MNDKLNHFIIHCWACDFSVEETYEHVKKQGTIVEKQEIEKIFKEEDKKFIEHMNGGF